MKTHIIEFIHILVEQSLIGLQQNCNNKNIGRLGVLPVALLSTTNTLVCIPLNAIEKSALALINLVGVLLSSMLEVENAKQFSLYDTYDCTKLIFIQTISTTAFVPISLAKYSFQGLLDPENANNMKNQKIRHFLNNNNRVAFRGYW